MDSQPSSIYETRRSLTMRAPEHDEEEEKETELQNVEVVFSLFLYSLAADDSQHFLFHILSNCIWRSQRRKMSLKRVLITGASGLIGRQIFNHLNTQVPRKYDVYGLDITTDVSSRYELEKLLISETDKQRTAIPQDRFVQCNVTNREELHRIIGELKIDIVIHLAASSPFETNVDNLLRVNVEGTRNVFEARKWKTWLNLING